MHKPLCAVFIKLRKNVVEQEHGALLAEVIRRLGAGELDRYHRRALLTLARHELRVPAVDDDVKILPVWTDERRALLTFTFKVECHTLKKRSPDVRKIGAGAIF